VKLVVASGVAVWPSSITTRETMALLVVGGVLHSSRPCGLSTLTGSSKVAELGVVPPFKVKENLQTAFTSRDAIGLMVTCWPASLTSDGANSFKVMVTIVLPRSGPLLGLMLAIFGGS